MRKEVYLQIAKNSEGKIVSIYEVPTGIDCNCFDPLSGSPLVAKNKNKRPDQELLPNQKVAHFARIDGQAIGSTALESAIHLLSKEVLLERKEIGIPPLVVEELVVSEKMQIPFVDVFTEKPVSGPDYSFQPDAIGITTKQELYIEFKKTHAVDYEKLGKIIKHGISCIEVDINNISPLDFEGKPNREGIYQIFQSAEFTSWLYNSKSLVLLEKKKEELEQEKILEQLEFEKKIEEEKHKAEREAKEEKEKEQRIRAWGEKLVKQGFKLLKIYEYEQFSYDSYYNENTGRTKSYKSFVDKEENVYCEKLKVGKENKRIETWECMDCEYYKNVYRPSKYGLAYVICGYRNKIRTK